jgi:SepF-like predicted cell division protein (DUF552 family)
MGLFSRDNSNTNGSLADQEFIDLRGFEGPDASDAPFEVRVAEMHQVEDIKALSGLVYDGDMLIIDFSPIADDEVSLQRVTKEFKKIADDVDGDVAGLGDETLIVTPSGVRVDRRKVRVQN